MKIIRFFATLLAVVLVLQTSFAALPPHKKVQGQIFSNFVGQTVTDHAGKSYVVDSHIGAGTYAQVYKVHDSATGAFYALRLYNDYTLNSPALNIFKENNDYNKMFPIEGTLRILAHGKFSAAAMGIKGTYGTLTELGVETAKTHAGFDLSGSKTGSDFLKRLRNLEKLMLFGMRTIENLKNNDSVHRDIKPSNILVMKDGSYRFGDVDFIGPATKWFIGTHHYMPPEVLRGANATYQSDLFSFGLSIAELIIGSPIGKSGRIREYKKLSYLDYNSLMEYKSNWPGTLEYITYELDQVVDMHQDIAIRERLMGLKQDILDLLSSDTSLREAVKDNYLPVRTSCSALF